MERKQNDAQAGQESPDERMLLKVTAAELRDTPAKHQSEMPTNARPADTVTSQTIRHDFTGSPPGGSGDMSATSTTTTPSWPAPSLNPPAGASATVDAEGETPPWQRWGLAGVGALAPLAALALPGVRRTLASTWRTGAEQAVETWESGARQVTAQVENVQEQVQEKRQAMRERKQLARAREYQRLLKTIENVQSELDRQERGRGFRPSLQMFAVGALVTGGAVLLYAPQAGEEVRAKLRGNANALKERATELTGQVSEATEEVRSQAAATFSQATTAVSNLTTSSTVTPTHATQITAQMPIVGANNEVIGMVDHLDAGNAIKVTKDAQGRHHWIPLQWVARVDQQVHLNRSSQQARQEWLSNAPRTS